MNNNSNNKIIIALLGVLIAAILIVGGYFIIKDLNKDKDDDHDDIPDTSQTTDKDSDQNDKDQPDSGSTVEPATPSAPEGIEASITHAEVRGNDYYIEAQTSGIVYGTCDISIMPTNGGQGHHETDDLEPVGNASTCDEDFSLKGMNPGEHKVTVIIYSSDGRSTTLEKIVNV